MKRIALLLAGLSAFVACGEGVNGGPTPPPVDAPSAQPKTPPANPPQKRTVIQRHPFGNVAATDNLLWDGDFEWRPSFPEQYGWLLGSGFNIGFGLPPLATGATCRSGIKCAVVTPLQSITGITVGAEAEDLSVSFWGRVESGVCDEINSSFVYELVGALPSQKIEPVDAAPGEDGWCLYEAIVPAQPSAAYLRIENRAETSVVIDDAVVVAVSATTQQLKSLRPAHDARRASAVSAAEEERLGAFRDAIRKARSPRNAPRSEGERALADHLQRLMR